MLCHSRFLADPSLAMEGPSKKGSWLCTVEAETGGHPLSTVFMQSCVTYNIGIVDSSFIPRRQWGTNFNYHVGTVLIDHQCG
jgi:hypothetical protein